jgi:hypothetical protein
VKTRLLLLTELGALFDPSDCAGFRRWLRGLRLLRPTQTCGAVDRQRQTDVLLAASSNPPLPLRLIAHLRAPSSNDIVDAIVPTHLFGTRRHRILQCAARPFVLLQDSVGFGCPLEWIRVGVALGDPGVDGGDEFVDEVRPPLE